LGLSTAFYNDRNEDIAEVLTKTLIETGQEVPDFLQQYVPENIADMKFEEDSEDENAPEDNAPATELADGNISDGWGTKAIHDAPVKPEKAVITTDSWGGSNYQGTYDSSTW
jgi:ATP-dependent RNA helicase DDX3X